MGRVGSADTAFSGGVAAYTYNLVSTWTDKAEDGQHIEATGTRPLSTPLSQDGPYPGNVFRGNHSIRPTR